MAAKAAQTIRIKGSVIGSPKGQALFVSVPAASQYDPTKQEATILLDAEGTAQLKAQLQDFIDSAEVKASGLKDTGFVSALFKDDLDADGNPTGLSRVKSKTSMQYPCALYDASGAKFTPDAGFSVPNRSDIRLSFKPEVMKTSMFTGLVLRLQALKVINKPTFDDGMEGTEDEGSFTYSAPETPTAAVATPEDPWAD